MDKRYNPVDFYQDLQPSKGPEVLAYSGRVCDTYVPLVLVQPSLATLDSRAAELKDSKSSRLMAYRQCQVNGHGGRAGLAVSRLCGVCFKINLTGYASISRQFTCRGSFRKDVHVEERASGFESLASSCRSLWAVSCVCQTKVERTSHAF